MSSFAFKKSGNTRFVKVENSVKVNEAEQTSKILQVFRETSSNDPDSLEPGELCFRIEIKMPSKKNTAKKKTIVFVGIGDNNVFTDALETCTKIVGGNKDSSVFMTDDGYGIAPNQSAGNVFFKYGFNLLLHVGVSLKNVSWHMRR